MNAGTTEQRRFPNRGITAKLRERFERAPGVVLYSKDLAEEFGCEERLIQQSVANIRREHNGQPLVHITARAWVFQPGAELKAEPIPSRRVFEELGVNKKTGEIVIQDDEGVLYRATEM